MTENSTRLEGKVALVTGASRGIGAAIARRFAREGAALVLAARDEAALNGVADEIRAEGGQSLVVPTDVADAAAVERLVRQAVETYGALHVAVNNAGVSHRPASLVDLSLDEFEQALRVNLTSAFVGMKYQIQAMLANGGGAIVNIASTAGLRGVPGIAGYVAAKYGMIGITKSAALEYANRNVRVNAIAPGPILNDRIAALTDEQRAPIGQAVPMQRIGLPDEVAAMALWLCSDESSYVTGEVISIDGGQMAGPANTSTRRS